MIGRRQFVKITASAAAGNALGLSLAGSPVPPQTKPENRHDAQLMGCVVRRRSASTALAAVPR